MNISYQFAPVVFSLKNRMRKELKGNQYKIMDTIADEIFLFQDTRLTLTKELSTRYLAVKTGICQPNIVRAVNKLEKKNFIRSIKSHVKGEGSLITIILDSTSISDNEASDMNLSSNQKKSDSTLLSNQENLFQEEDLQKRISDSSLKIQIEQAIEKNSPQETPLYSSEENNLNMSAVNLLPAGLGSGKSEFTALGSLLSAPSVVSAPAVLSDKGISTGKAILLKKGFSPEEVSQITDRITASMTDKDIKSKDKYFIAACNNEKKNNSKVAVHNTSHKVAAPPSRPSRPTTTQKEIEKPVNPAELLEKIKLTAPTELFEIIMTVDNDRKTQRALEFLPGELKKEALANLYIAAFKKTYPEISLK